MKKFILFIYFISITLGAKAQIDTALATQLQNVLNKSVTLSGNHGVSAYLIMPEGQIWNGTAGLGHQNLPITDTTLFHGASTTKLNIAILMMLLVEDSLIDLDKTWNNYVTLNVDFDTLITVRQLLNHTSGIADYLETAGSGKNITSDFNYFFTPEYILENIVSGVPKFPAGTDFQYSNSNYALAALIAEAVTGNPVQTELRNRIWEPLGLDHTYFGAYDSYTEPTAGVWWNLGSGLKNYSNMPTTSMLSYAYGSGNIVSCPTDLGILLYALLNDHLLSAQSLEEMLTFVPKSYSSWTAGYGLGIHHQKGQTSDDVLGHDGYYTNLTDMFYSKNYGFTLVTMTNTQTTWFGIFNSMYDVLSDYFSSLDVIELENKIDVSVYPNPTKNILTIETEIPSHYILKIMQLNGQEMFSTSMDGKSKEIDLSALKTGVYLLSIRSGVVLRTQKIVKY